MMSYQNSPFKGTSFLPPPSRQLRFRPYPDLATTETLAFPNFIVFSSALTTYANRKECAEDVEVSDGKKYKDLQSKKALGGLT